MTIPAKKLKNGFEMPVFGFGTWMMGGDNSPDPNNDDQRDINAIKNAIDLGINLIDTAEVYGASKAEEIVGKAIQNYDRNKLFLSSKVQQSHLNYRDIKVAIKDSLKRIGTNYLNLYYLHRYPGDHKLEECIKALDELADEGLIRHLGISNFNLEHTKRAKGLAKHPIAATQVHFSVKFREPESSGLLDYCQKNDILLVAWRPLGMGVLKRGNTQLENEPLIKKFCNKYNKTPPQVAINWLISQPNVVTLSKTANINHLKENLGAIGWQMENSDIEELRQNFTSKQNTSDTIPLA